MIQGRSCFGGNQKDPKDVLFDGSKPTSQTYSQLGKTKYGKGKERKTKISRENFTGRVGREKVNI